MPRKNWVDGMELIYQDLSQINASSELEFYDRILYELMNRQQNIVFGDSFTVTYVNATTVKVKAGHGMQNDSTQVDPEPQNRPLYLASDTNKTLAAADPSNNRIDIVCIKNDRATSSSASRNTKDPTSGVVTSVSQIIETDWSATLTVTTGTPSGSPAVPSTPVGYIKLAEVLVVAVSGLASQAGITDKRPRYFKPTATQNVSSVAAAFTPDQDTDVYFVNLNGAAFAATLPSAASMSGKLFTFIKTDSSGNALTLTGTISGETNPTVDTQYTSVSIVSDGTSWYWK